MIKIIEKETIENTVENEVNYNNNVQENKIDDFEIDDLEIENKESIEDEIVEKNVSKDLENFITAFNDLNIEHNEIHANSNTSNNLDESIINKEFLEPLNKRIKKKLKKKCHTNNINSINKKKPILYP